MKIFVDISQLFVRHMCVDLGGGDIGVAEEGLDGAEVGAVAQQIGGERMADSVGSNLFGNAGFDGVVFDDSFY